jgi:hypothetical protein
LLHQLSGSGSLADLHLSHSHSIGFQKAFKDIIVNVALIAAPLLLEDRMIADPDLIVGSEQFGQSRAVRLSRRWESLKRSGDDHHKVVHP